MRQDNLISIIVPLYNVETYLPWCLDSIMAQSYQNFELFLVDDGSTDDSGAICDEYASKDNRINVIHQKNSGPSIARNTALDQIKGEYLTFIDSDDVVHHRYLEVLLENMQNYGADISAVTFSRVSEYGKLGEADFSGKVATYNPIKAIKRILYQKDLENSEVEPDNQEEAKIIEEEVSGENVTEEQAEIQIEEPFSEENGAENNLERVTEVMAVETQEDSKNVENQ